MESRERYRQVLLKHRVNPVEPGSEAYWAPELEIVQTSGNPARRCGLTASVAFDVSDLVVPECSFPPLRSGALLTPASRVA
jgi:hypothetical protein